MLWYNEHTESKRKQGGGKVEKKKFVMSYSCGKDSTLALHQMMAAGHEPIALLVMFNQAAERSYFHGADARLLRAYEQALEIPLLCVPTSGEDYHLAMEKTLRQAKEMGAEAVCFGDIDIEGNRAWSTQRCINTGLEAVFPLWHAGRRENVAELLHLGYRCLIKSINNTLLPKSLLGRVLDEEVVRIMEECGVDVCGENGEYHTLTVDGPVFHRPIAYRLGRVLDFGSFSVIEIDENGTVI